MELVAVDIGGTHARFALATVEGGRVTHLGEAVTLKTAEHASFQLAWQEFQRINGGAVPSACAIAVAGPVGGEVIKFTNNPWIIRPAMIPEKLGAEKYIVVNDFAAVAHSVAQADDAHFLHLSGPDQPLPHAGTISVVGPGTGLGVAQLWRSGDGGYHVQPTEGGHIDYAPLDGIEDAILARLRKRHRRVSAERVVAGPGIVDIYETLAAIEGTPFIPRDDKAIWTLGTSGEDSLACGDRPVLPVARQRCWRSCACTRRIRRRHGRRPRPAYQGHAGAIGICRAVPRQGSVRADDGADAGAAHHASAAWPVRRCRCIRAGQSRLIDHAAALPAPGRRVTMPACMSFMTLPPRLRKRSRSAIF